MITNSKIACREAFENWAKEGTRPHMYDLLETAGGEYVSVFTEHAWRAFQSGWAVGLGRMLNESFERD